MLTAQQTLDRYFLEMRWRCLSLAADLDRVQRQSGGDQVMAADPRVRQLKEAINLLLRPQAQRAEAVLDLFSDHSPVE